MGSNVMKLITGLLLALVLVGSQAYAASVGQIDAGTLLGRLTGAGNGPPLQVPMAAASLTDGNTGTGAIVHAVSPTLTGTIAAANQTLSGTLGVTGAATLGGTLGVTGATTLSSTLGVTDATTLGVLSAGATTLSSTLGVTGATTLSSTLGVTGATTLGDTLGVTGATTLSSTLGVTGATTLSSTLGVTGIATFSDQVFFSGDPQFYTRMSGSDPIINFDDERYIIFDRTLDRLSLVAGVANAIILSATGGLTVTGAATLNSLAVTGATTIGTNATVGGNTVLSGLLQLDGITITPGSRQPLCMDTTTKVVYYGNAGVC